MKIIDKRTPIKTKEFGELPVGTTFEFPVDSEGAEYYGACMKINSANHEDNAIDLVDCTIFTVHPDERICELKAYLIVMEGGE